MLIDMSKLSSIWYYGNTTWNDYFFDFFSFEIKIRKSQKHSTVFIVYVATVIIQLLWSVQLFSKVIQFIGFHVVVMMNRNVKRYKQVQYYKTIKNSSFQKRKISVKWYGRRLIRSEGGSHSPTAPLLRRLCIAWALNGRGDYVFALHAYLHQVNKCFVGEWLWSSGRGKR